MRHMKPTAHKFSTLLKGLVIVSAVMTLVALCFLPAAYHRNDSTRWPTTSGVVRATALTTSFEKPHTTTEFSPFLSYSYAVDGIPRASTRIDFADRVQLPKEQALAWLDRNYPIGKQVTVFYDPKNPDLAVLVPGANELVFICWCGAGTAAFCCAASSLLLTRQKRRLPHALGE
jgi:Protein of unknown function (DUF3592)